MASFRSKFQISSLLTSSNTFNLLLRQQPWHCFQPGLCSKRNINEERCHECEKLTSVSTSDPKSYELKKKKRRTSTKIKDVPIVNCKVRKSPKQKLTLWKYVFGRNRKKSRVDFRTCRLAYCRKQAHRLKDPRLCNPHYQKTAGDVLIYTESIEPLKKSKNIEPQPKPSPAYKMPKALLLNKMMTEDFKKNKNCKDEIVTSTASVIKLCKKIKPLTDGKITKHQDVASQNINEKSMFHPISMQQINLIRGSTVKILRLAMIQEEPRGLSRIEKLKTLMNEKMFES